MDILNLENFYFNYSAGLKSKFHINDKLSIKACLGYEYNKYDLSKMVMFEQFPRYIDVQLIAAACHLRFDWLAKEKKIAFYGFVGPTINSSIRERADFEYLGSIDNKKIRIYNALLAGGLGLGLPVTKHLVVEIEPSYSISVWTNRTAAASVYDARLGLNIGLVYKSKID